MLAEAAAAGIAIYPHKFHTNISVPDFVAKYAHLGKGEQLKEEKVAVAGRVLLKRAAGAKLMFYDLRGDGTTVQILSDARDYEGEEEFKQIHSLLRRGTHSLFATLLRYSRFSFNPRNAVIICSECDFGASLPTFPIR